MRHLIKLFAITTYAKLTSKTKKKSINFLKN